MNMIKELNLTTEQKMKLKETRQALSEKKEAIENDDKLSAEQKEQRLREIKIDQARNMQTILNQEQREKMKAMRQKLFKNRKMDQQRLNN